MEGNSRPGHEAADLFYSLPEGCIDNAISLTTPRDACRLSLVASTVRSAADSDSVWERFIPSDYDEIAARSVSHRNSISFASKKELYLNLCDHPLLIDGGTKRFSLEKFSGKKCFMLAARDLSIVWGDTPRYWKWTCVPDSRFTQVAELNDVCWLEINGKINTGMLSKETLYAAYLVFKLTARHYGFDYRPQHVSVGVIGSEAETRAVHLDSQGKERGDGWLEMELGEYLNSGVKQGGELKMSVMGMNGGNWKSGLIVQGIEIRPKARPPLPDLNHRHFQNHVGYVCNLTQKLSIPFETTNNISTTNFVDFC